MEHVTHNKLQKPLTEEKQEEIEEHIEQQRYEDTRAQWVKQKVKNKEFSRDGWYRDSPILENGEGYKVVGLLATKSHIDKNKERFTPMTYEEMQTFQDWAKEKHIYPMPFE